MKNKTVNHGIVSVLVLGLMLGLILSALIPLKPYGEIFAAALCIAGVLLLLKKKLTPGAAMWALSLLAFQAVLLKVTGVYADDGGWQEAGGTLGTWLRSPGAGTAVAMGLPPALSSLLGALLGGSNVPKPPPIPEVMDYNVKGWRWINEKGQWVLYQTDDAGNKHGKGIPQSVFEADPEYLGNSIKIYTQPTCNYDEPVKKVNDVMDNLGKGYTDHFTSENWKNMSNAEKENALKALSKVVADAAGVDPNSFNLTFTPQASVYSNGSWSPDSRTLNLNPNSLNFDNPLKTIKTMAHELRHAAQGDPNAELGGGKDYRDLISWNDKNENYQVAGTDFTRYSGQLLERDADAFGRSISRAVMQQVINRK
ncbi:MAG: hypothetical protein FIA99_09845 [Ruminiclostridium sp.]|nr:hypothetical protein [Ruminiclostridium sp.]